MIEYLKRIIYESPLAFVYLYLRHHFPNRRTARQWIAAGRPTDILPPHYIKQQIVREYGQRFGLHTLVETGTYMGDMVFAMRNDFTRIYSIELSPLLARRAQQYFTRCPHITIIEGDSGQVFSQLLPTLDTPPLFWLDGHFSHGLTAKGDLNTPIRREITAILTTLHITCCILIDDACAFGNWTNYPPLEEVRQLVATLRPGWTVTVEEDVIRITPDHF